jgi:hypothetical protein
MRLLQGYDNMLFYISQPVSLSIEVTYSRPSVSQGNVEAPMAHGVAWRIYIYYAFK